MKPLIHCIYASTATAQFAEHEIPALLEQARAKNALTGVTGVLLYIEGSFFQVLEGEPEAVDSIYDVIRTDLRHERVTLIIREPIVDRVFNDWSMGFSTLDKREAAQMIGENDFFKDGTSLTRLGSGRAKKLLNAFLAGRWRTEHTGTFQVPGRVA